MTKPVVDLFEKVEIMVAGERWWVVGPKGSGKTVLHLLLSGEPVSDTSYQMTGIDERTTSGITRTGNKTVRHKATQDYGGEFLESWEIGVQEHERFVFVYSLTDIDGSSCFQLNEQATRPAEKFVLNKDDLLYENIMNAFILAINIISDNFAENHSLPPHKRKLLVVCNKMDLWPAGSRPQFFQPYIQMVGEMKREVEALHLCDSTRFEVIYDACSFIALPRTRFDAIMSKFLGKV
ncbi:MAG TPA: hypothetical protein VK399_11040 [Longimicrobiaceae bacterium]|nr:hypothetical protein [Longimicrobiaceae bacterium]